MVYDKVVKRALDLVGALVVLPLAAPLLLVIALLVKASSKGPVFYRGQRAGLNNKPFGIFKFRSMVVNAENIGGGTTALNDPRITQLGGFLRKTKLDEIPQLFNIIFGDMSFVGPRPELLRYTNQYTKEEQLILTVRPGITDLSSLEFINLDEIVGVENADEQYEKFVLKKKNALRMKYVQEQSFLLDMKIFFLTLWRVVEKAAKHMGKGQGHDRKNTAM